MITSEDKCLNMRNVKFKFYFFPKMRYKFLMFITTVNFLFLLRLLVQYNYSADHSDFFLAFLVFLLISYWGSCAPVKLYRGGTGLACRSIKDGG